ncbi:transposase [Methylobacterium sp. BTF04]|nr:transposase [Methylobacterium sp. BTF04]
MVQNRDLESTNNGSERALRPCAVYRKITNGFRQEWGAYTLRRHQVRHRPARRRSRRAIDAIRLKLKGQTICASA